MNSSQPPPAKRLRIGAHANELDDDSESSTVKYSEPWFDDGNVILEAEQTQFKVYRGILCENSQIFRDMFAIPQSPTSHDKMQDGCPVVQLSDCANEVRHVLKALCQRRCHQLVFVPIGNRLLTN